MPVKLQWATPDIDAQIAYIARVSNPSMQDKPIGSILQYMMREGHTSPFGQVNVNIEITTERDIARQIMRHWSLEMHELEVQEFSQRYQSVGKLPEAPLRECRLQDTKNRQNSLPNDDRLLDLWWEQAQANVLDLTGEMYDQALQRGIAKELARSVLPEGLTPTRFYLNGTLRNWIFFLKSRLHATAQKEVRVIGEGVLQVLRGVAPATISTFFDAQGHFIDPKQERIAALETALAALADRVEETGATDVSYIRLLLAGSQSPSTPNRS